MEQTAALVLDMFPDLELAVEEGIPELATEFFRLVRGWIADLHAMVHAAQAHNQKSMLQVPNLLTCPLLSSSLCRCE